MGSEMCIRDSADDDNDGTPDDTDAFPLDDSEQVDADSAGTGDNADEDDENEGDIDEYIVDPNRLREGNNVIAVEMHNGSRSSSDMVMEIQLDATRTNPLNEPLKISKPMTVKARSYNGNEWSAVTSASFTVNTVAPSPDNLAIVELSLIHI